MDPTARRLGLRHCATLLFLLMAMSMFGSSAGYAETLEVEVLTVHWQNAEDIAPKLRERLSYAGALRTEKRTNTVIVRDYPVNLKAIRALLEQLDVKPEQIMVTTAIVNGDLLEKAGVKVTWKDLEKGWSVGTATAPPGALIGLHTRSTALGVENRQTLLLAEGAEGELFSGREIHMPESVWAYALKSGDVQGSLPFKSAGVSMRVKPLSFNNGFIRLVFTPVFSEYSGAGKFPIASYAVSVALEERVEFVIGATLSPEEHFVADLLKTGKGDGTADRLLFSIMVLREQPQ